MSDFLELSFGPPGRSIMVDPSGRLIATNDPEGGLFPYSFGKTGRACVVDASGRLVFSPLSTIIGSGGGGAGTIDGTGAATRLARFQDADTLESANIVSTAAALSPAAASTVNLGQLATRFKIVHAQSGNFGSGVQVGGASLFQGDVLIKTPSTNQLRIDASQNTGFASNFALESDRPGNSDGQQGGRVRFENQGAQPYAEVAGLVVSDTTGMLEFRTSDQRRMLINEVGVVAVSGVARVDETLHTPVRNKASASGLSLNMAVGNIFRIVLGHNVTFTLSNPRSGAKYSLILKQDNTGGRTAAWPASVKWRNGAAPTLTSPSGSVDIVTMIYEPTDSVFYADVGQDFS